MSRLSCQSPVVEGRWRRRGKAWSGQKCDDWRQKRFLATNSFLYSDFKKNVESDDKSEAPVVDKARVAGSSRARAR